MRLDTNWISGSVMVQSSQVYLAWQSLLNIQQHQVIARCMESTAVDTVQMLVCGCWYRVYGWLQAYS
jgi:hypothetical protein